MSTLNLNMMRGEDVKPCVTAFHGKSVITGLDVCVRKPLIVTCGLDKSVRAWNYHEHRMELCKYFSEEPLSIALHPTGPCVARAGGPSAPQPVSDWLRDSL
jgi:hypothetical protein